MFIDQCSMNNMGFESIKLTPPSRKKRLGIAGAIIIGGLMAGCDDKGKVPTSYRARSVAAEAIDNDVPEKSSTEVIKSLEKKVDEKGERSLASIEKRFGHDNRLWKELNKMVTTYLGYIKNEKSREKTAKTFGDYAREAQEAVWKDVFDGNARGQNNYFKKVVNNLELRQEIRDLCVKYAEKYGIPLEIFLGVIATESHFNQEVKNPIAFGLGQVTPEVAVDSGVVNESELFDIKYVIDSVLNKKTNKFEKQKRKVRVNSQSKRDALVERLKAEKDFNLEVSAASLKFLYKEYGDWGLALVAYNGGQNGLERKFYEIYKKRLQADYQARKKRGEIVKPPVFNFAMWQKHRDDLVRQNRFTLATILNEETPEFATHEYPFRVLAMAGPAQEVLLTDNESPKMTRLQVQDVVPSI